MPATNLPVSGIFGKTTITVSGVTTALKLNQWSWNDSVNGVPNNHFDMTASADGGVREDVIAGLINSVVDFSGLVDTADILQNRLIPGERLDGSSNYFWFGYNAVLGIKVNGMMMSYTTGTDITGAATISGQFKVTNVQADSIGA